MAQMIDTCTSQIVGDDPSRERLEAMYAICTQMEGGVAQFEKTLGECLSGDERNALQSLARHKKESAFASEDSLLLKSCLVIREQFENLHLPLKEATKIALAKTIAIGDVDDIVWGYHHWVAARKESVWDDATMRNLTEQEQKALLINQTTYEVGSTLPKKKPKVL
jgi:dipeptidase